MNITLLIDTSFRFISEVYMFFCVIYGGIFCIMFNLIKFLFDMAVGLETTLSLVQNLFGHSKQCRLKLLNPLTPMSDQDRIFPDNVNTI